MQKIYQKFLSIYRLSFSLSKANFKLRNEGSYLGIFWYLLSPLSYFAVILILKGTIFTQSEIQYYPLYLMTGLIMFHFFIHTIGDSIGIIQSNAGLIKSVKMPHEALVVSRVMQSVYAHIFEIALLSVFLLFYGISLVNLLFYIPIFLFFFVFTLGISFFFSAAGVFLTDLRNIWNIFTQLLFFITPIFHMPPKGSLLETINQFNPLSYFLELGRSVFIDISTMHFSSVAIILLFSLVSLCLGWWVFNFTKARFAELV